MPTDAGTGCYAFPAATEVVDISSAPIPSTSPKTATAALADFTGWSIGEAAQLVAMQWLFTRSGAASTACPIDVTITDIRFVP